MPIEDYFFERRLNTGGVSNVYRCKDKETHEERAVKIIDITQHDPKWWNKEIQVLSSLQYVRGVVKMYEFGQYICQESKHTMGYIIMELCGTDLRDHPLSETEKPRFIQFILRTLYLVHVSGWVLCDLKLENIVRMHHGFRIVDMGACQHINKSTRHFVGTDHILAPEVIYAMHHHQPIKYTEKIDIWNLGCILFEIYAQETPFGNRASIRNTHKLHHNILTKRVQIEKIPVVSMRRFIQQMLHKNPLRRPSLMDMVKMFHEIYGDN